MRDTPTYVSSTAKYLDSPRATIVLVCLVAALSFVAPKVEGALMLNPQTVWPLWPGCAILVSVLLLVRTSVWPALIFASFTGFVLYDLQVGVSVGSIVWFIPADTVQVLTAAIGLRFCFDWAPRLNSVDSLAKYGFFAVLLAPFAASFISARGIPGSYWTSWRISFFSEVLAFITLTPAILGWSIEGAGWVRKPAAYHIEFGVLTLATVLLGYFTFVAGRESDPALLYSLIPFLLWSALRFGWIGTANLLLIVSFLAVWGVVHERGPFTAEGPQNSMLALQLFLIFASIPFMILTAVVEDRRLAGEKLAGLGRKLIEAQEEERKRIARDIHDDYTQRIAVLSIHVEEMLKSVGGSSPEVEERLRELFEGIGELATDMHSLSHQLHSSTLESLGLVAGVRAFCREFAKREQIEIDFADGKVPSGIPADVALCLFRVVQEGLRNVRKHSGAKNAAVRVEGAGRDLHVTVSDYGKGFNVGSPPESGGIGIWSMQERVRLLGGRLEIQSHLTQGTRIDAWLPVNAGEGKWVDAPKKARGSASA
jgi:signal transduction histidine kinase